MSRRLIRGSALIVAGWLCVGFPAAARGQSTKRVNLGPGDTQASGASFVTQAGMTPDGRFVVFETTDNLVPSDTNNVRDIYVRDRQSGTTTLASVGAGGVLGTSTSTQPAISADGRFVAFASLATNLVSGDSNGQQDIFVRDRQTSATTRVSVATGGAQGLGGASSQPSISADGRFVAFLSSASNLVSGDTNAVQDVFLHDRQTGTTTRVSVDAAGAQSNGSSGGGAPAISGDGRFVAFESSATNLVAGDTNNAQDMFHKDTVSGAIQRTNLGAGGAQSGGGASLNASISADGRYVAFESTNATLVAGDTNGHRDIFVRDTQAAVTTRVSVATGGSQATGGAQGSLRASLSADGRYVLFASDDTNLVAGDTNGFADVFLHDRQTTTTTRESLTSGGSEANGVSQALRVSADGSLTLFTSGATNLVAGDTNGVSEPFVRVHTPASTERVALQANGSAMDFEADTPSLASLSADGRYVAFLSGQTSLVAPDTNQSNDVYLRDRVAGTTVRASVTSTGGLPNGFSSGGPVVSDDGRFVVFTNASDLVAGDTNASTDVFLFDSQGGSIERVSVDSAEAQANQSSSDPRLSSDSRFVAFQSTATNLVASDTNAVGDIFVRDRQSGTTTRVSVGPLGAQSNGASARPSLSSTGRWVAFESAATTLVGDDTSSTSDVFVHDRQSGTTTRVSVGAGGVEADGPSNFARISGDGRYVMFLSTATNLAAGATGNHLYRYDRQTSQVVQVDVSFSGGQPNATMPLNAPAAISSDGRYIAFASPASNLQEGAAGGGVFRRDMTTGVTTRVSVSTAGVGVPYINIVAGSIGMSADGQHVAFGAFTTLLVPGDTNNQADIFVHSLGVTDEDGDGLLTTFENTFGLDPTSSSGAQGASGDPDGDGQTNAQEQTAGTHPRGFFKRYLAEGANSAFFDTHLALFNPGTSDSLVQVRMLKSDGTSVSREGRLTPLERSTLDADDVPELANAEFSTVLEADNLVVLDRTMTWDSTAYGAHAETGVASPSTTWYLAEGSTAGGFSLFYLLQNPDLTTAAQVKVTFLLPSGSPVERTYTLQPKSRSNIWVNQIPQLAATDVSAVIEVTSGPGIVVERAMYLSTPTAVFNAGHNSAGVTAPAMSWFLAEGSTTNFEEFILLANPGTGTSTVRITYLLGNGSTLVKNYAVGSRSRFNVWVDEESFNGLKALAAVDVSAKVEVLSGPPIIVERAMWWPGSIATWAEAHNTPGATQTGTKWALAEGEVLGTDDLDTFILIANTSATPGTVDVRLYFEDGGSQTKTFNVPANSRTNAWVRVDFPSAVGRRFGAVVESTGASPVQIVVERAMYGKAAGVAFASGTNALATRLQ